MWYVIWTSSSHEDLCIKLLEERFDDLYIRAFVPKRTISRKRGGIWVTEKTALFPGYLFADVDEANIKTLATGLRNISGFNILLTTDGKFLPLTQSESEFAEMLYASDGTFDVSTGIIEGDKITVTGGPLIGLEGFITKIDRHKRKAYLELDMFGVMTKTTVSLEIV
ncbi:MAG: antiterminator LoaP, partial [Clostridiales bacterium]|nr:antiterminator LoaP [Clostridiales bacterium]